MTPNRIPRTADIVIVGAGVMGASLAFHLARRKAGRVVVIEKDHVGSGSSGRSSGLIRMHYTYPPEVQLAVKSLEMFQNWEEIVGEPSDFRKTGFVRIVPRSEAEDLKRNVEMQELLGVKVRLISSKDLREIEPDWFVDDIDVAAYEPDSGYGDGVNVAGGFLSRARELGVAYVPKTTVSRVQTEKSQVRGVATPQGEIAAPVVVLATGVWTTILTDPLGIELPIKTEYHQVAILKNPAGMKPHGSACIDSVNGIYFRSDGPDKTLVGNSGRGQPVSDPENFPQCPTQESLAEISDGACCRMPALGNAELVRGITGLCDKTPDSRAILGVWPGVQGLYIVAGFSGTGFKIAPAIGLVMCELLLDGKATTVDVTPFRPTRFAEGQLIRAPHEYSRGRPARLTH